VNGILDVAFATKPELLGQPKLVAFNFWNCSSLTVWEGATTMLSPRVNDPWGQIFHAANNHTVII
jgi:hypothetical protein